jgi:heme/copper-type cytochrome/quinol oxidase subunit 2
MRRAIVAGVFSALAVLVLVLPWPARAPRGPEREVVVRARQYAYTPGVVRVGAGERVTLVLEADDVTHGLYLDGYGIDLVAVPGRPARGRLVVDRPGKFRFRCSKVCGPLHPFMLGELIVEPNRPLWRAAALVLVAAAGTVVVLVTGRGASSQEARACTT